MVYVVLECFWYNLSQHKIFHNVYKLHVVCTNDYFLQYTVDCSSIPSLPEIHSTLADMNSPSLEKNMSWRLATGLFYYKFSLQNVYCDYQNKIK